MKTQIAWSAAGLVAVTFLLGARPLASVEKPASLKSIPESPLFLHCVVAIENDPWLAEPPPQVPGLASGIQPDSTIRGKLLHLGVDWVVIGEGTYENWISRDKVVNIRVSR